MSTHDPKNLNWAEDCFEVGCLGPITATGTRARILIGSMDGCRLYGCDLIKLHAEFTSGEDGRLAATAILALRCDTGSRLDDDELDEVSDLLIEAIQGWLSDGGGLSMLEDNEGKSRQAFGETRPAQLMASKARVALLTDTLSLAPVSGAASMAAMLDIISEMGIIQKIEAQSDN